MGVVVHPPAGGASIWTANLVLLLVALAIGFAILVVPRRWIREKVNYLRAWRRAHQQELTLPEQSAEVEEDELGKSSLGSKKKKKGRRKRNLPTGGGGGVGSGGNTSQTAMTTEDETEAEEPTLNAQSQQLRASGSKMSSMVKDIDGAPAGGKSTPRSVVPLTDGDTDGDGEDVGPDGSDGVDGVGDPDDSGGDDQEKRVRFAPSEAMLRKQAKKAARKAAKAAAQAVQDLLGTLDVKSDLTVSSLDKLYVASSDPPGVAWPTVDPSSTATDTTGAIRKPRARTMIALPTAEVATPIWKLGTTEHLASATTTAASFVLAAPSASAASSSSSSFASASSSPPPSHHPHSVIPAPSPSPTPIVIGGEITPTDEEEPATADQPVEDQPPIGTTKTIDTRPTHDIPMKAVSPAPTPLAVVRPRPKAKAFAATTASAIGTKPATTLTATMTPAAVVADIAAVDAPPVHLSPTSTLPTSALPTFPLSHPVAVVASAPPATQPAAAPAHYRPNNKHIPPSARPVVPQATAAATTGVTEAASAFTAPPAAARHTPAVEVDLPLLSPSLFGGYFGSGNSNLATTPASIVGRSTPGVGVIGGGGGGGMLGSGVVVRSGSHEGLYSSTVTVTSTSLDLREAHHHHQPHHLHHHSSSGALPSHLQHDSATSPVSSSSSLFSFMKESLRATTTTASTMAHSHPHARAPSDEILQFGGAHTRPPLTVGLGVKSHHGGGLPSHTSPSGVGATQWHEDDLALASSTSDYDELMAEYEAYRRSPLLEQAETVLMHSPALLPSLLTTSPTLLSRQLLTPPHASSSGSGSHPITPPNGLMAPTSSTSGTVAHPRPPMHGPFSARIGASGSSTGTSGGGGGLINPTLSVPHQWASFASTRSPSHSSHPSSASSSHNLSASSGGGTQSSTTSSSAMHSSHFLSPFMTPGGERHSQATSPNSTSPLLPLSPAAMLTPFTNMFVSSPAGVVLTPGSGGNSAMQTPPGHSPSQSPPFRSQPTPPRGGGGGGSGNRLEIAGGNTQGGPSSHGHSRTGSQHYPGSYLTTTTAGVPSGGIPSATGSGHFSPNSHYTSLTTTSTGGTPGLQPPAGLSTLSSLSPQQVSQLQALLASAQAQAAVANIQWTDPSGSSSSAGSGAYLAPSPVQTTLSASSSASHTPSHHLMPTLAGGGANASAAGNTLLNLTPPHSHTHSHSHTPTFSPAQTNIGTSGGGGGGAGGVGAATAAGGANNTALQQQQLQQAWQTYVQQAHAYMQHQQTTNPGGGGGGGGHTSSTPP